MKIFVFMTVLILFFAFFTVQNTLLVPVKLGDFSITTPLPLAIIVPISVAMLLFAFFHLGLMRKASLVIRDLEDNVENSQNQILEITKQAHALEIENRKLKIRLGEESDVDDRSL
jgi:uncharacterized membrane protein YciS (DUF1049 family)